MSDADRSAPDLLAPIPFPPVPVAPHRALLDGPDARRTWWRDHVTDRLDGWGARLFLWSLRWLPVDWCSAVGAALGRTFPRAMVPEPALRARLAANIDHFLPGDANPARFAQAWYVERGRVLAEYAVVDRLVAEERVVLDGAAHLDAACATGRPLIFVSLHLSNWELFLTALSGRGGIGAARGLRIAATNRPPRNRFSRRLAADLRARNGRLAFPPGTATARRLRQILTARAGHVAFLIDEVKDGEIAAPRFGRPPAQAGNLVIAAKLACATDALILPGLITRDRGAHFTLRFAPAQDPRDFAPDTTGRIALQNAVSDIAEGQIRASLGQWWNLRRIPTPNGETEHDR
ncbi:MAG: hypothetical protein AAGE18_13590 [Pseudomonadota bacterium]